MIDLSIMLVNKTSQLKVCINKMLFSLLLLAIENMTQTLWRCVWRWIYGYLPNLGGLTLVGSACGMSHPLVDRWSVPISLVGVTIASSNFEYRMSRAS